MRALKARAQPLTDTPNSVLRRLLGLDGNDPATTLAGALPAPRARDPMAWDRVRWEVVGALMALDGEGHVGEVAALTSVGIGLGPRRRDADNRAAARREGDRMLEDGLIEAPEPHRWRLTDVGRRYFTEGLLDRGTESPGRGPRGEPVDSSHGARDAADDPREAR
jgi:hypothetical protein